MTKTKNTKKQLIIEGKKYLYDYSTDTLFYDNGGKVPHRVFDYYQYMQFLTQRQLHDPLFS